MRAYRTNKPEKEQLPSDPLAGAARAKLEEALGSVDDKVWTYLVSRGHVAAVFEGKSTFEALKREYLELARMGREPRAAEEVGEMVEGREPRARRGAGSTPPNLRALRQRVLSALFADAAALDEEVVDFRRRYVTPLIDRTQVEAWIEERKKKDGKPSIWLEFPLPEGHRFSAVGEEIEPKLVLSKVEGGWSVGGRSLSYGLPGEAFRRLELVAAGGVLELLRGLSETLEKRYGWDASQATVFVLTGGVPLLRMVKARSSFKSTYSASSTITLTIDPAATPAQVASAYRQVRAQVVSARVRMLDERHLNLAEAWGPFTADHHPDVAARMKKWNDRWRASKPKWLYKSVARFREESALSVERLVQPSYRF